MIRSSEIGRSVCLIFIKNPIKNSIKMVIGEYSSIENKQMNEREYETKLYSYNIGKQMKTIIHKLD